MRDATDTLFARLEVARRRAPELRLGQLIERALAQRGTPRLADVTDATLAAALEALLGVDHQETSVAAP